MFTGIIQDLGKIKSRNSRGDSINFVAVPESAKFLKDVKEGDSISVNGACMTIEKKTAKSFYFTTIKESLSKTNLSLLKVNDLANLEKAMTLSSRLDGHIVQGHVDTIGIVKKIIPQKDSWEFYIEFSAKFGQYIINIGSVAVNGVSLTIADIAREDANKIMIKVAIIPHTFKVTNFKNLREKDIVNLEFDMLGKYVSRIILYKKKPAAK